MLFLPITTCNEVTESDFDILGTNVTVAEVNHEYSLDDNMNKACVRVLPEFRLLEHGNLNEIGIHPTSITCVGSVRCTRCTWAAYLCG